MTIVHELSSVIKIVIKVITINLLSPLNLIIILFKGNISSIGTVRRDYIYIPIRSKILTQWLFDITILGTTQYYNRNKEMEFIHTYGHSSNLLPFSFIGTLNLAFCQLFLYCIISIPIPLWLHISFQFYHYLIYY